MSSSSPYAERERLFTREFALVLLVQLTFGYAYSSFFLLPKFVVNELHGSASAVGLVSALALATAVSGAIWAGKLLDRGPRRPLIWVGTLMLSFTSALFLMVHELGPLLYLTRALQGLGFTLFFVAATTLVVDISPPARLGQALGWFGSGALVMNALATLIAERLAESYGWSAVFLTATGMGALSFSFSLLLREPEARRDRPSFAPSAGRTGRKDVLAAAVAGGAAFGVMFCFTQPFALSLGERNVSPLFAGYTVSALGVRMLFGGFADRFGRRRIGAVALGLYALVVIGAATLSRGELWYLGLGFGLAHGAFYPSLNALALEGAAHDQRGSRNAYFSAAFNGGMALVSIAGGGIADWAGYPAIFLLTGLITAGGAFVLWAGGARRLPTTA